MDGAAIVLCGGFSRRMGRDKWSLPFGGETLLDRVVRLAGEACAEVVVVARAGQEVETSARVVRDPAEGLGPLAGLVAGLSAVAAERAFLTACDTPFLVPALIRRLLALSAGHDLAVPEIDGRSMSTTAVYARTCLPAAERLLAERRLRPFFLREACRARVVTADELRDADPELDSFAGCNTEEEYRTAVARLSL